MNISLSKRNYFTGIITKYSSDVSLPLTNSHNLTIQMQSILIWAVVQHKIFYCHSTVQNISKQKEFIVGCWRK